jgi:hypothetical protein
MNPVHFPRVFCGSGSCFYLSVFLFRPGVEKLYPGKIRRKSDTLRLWFQWLFSRMIPLCRDRMLLNGKPDAEQIQSVNWVVRTVDDVTASGVYFRLSFSQGLCINVCKDALLTLLKEAVQKCISPSPGKMTLLTTARRGQMTTLEFCPQGMYINRTVPGQGFFYWYKCLDGQFFTVVSGLSL